MELIRRDFTFGEQLFSEWYAENIDVEHLVMHGDWGRADYDDFVSVDILDPDRGLRILDMGDSRCSCYFWDYNYSWGKRDDVCCSKIIYPEGITHIHISSEFYGLFNEVVLPSTIEEIWGLSFRDCELKDIILPDGLREIQYMAFARNLFTEVNIPDSCTLIEERAFAECPHLVAINVSDNHPTYKTIDGSLYSKDGRNLIHAAPGIKDLVIAEGTVKVCEGAVAGIFARSITFPSTLECFEEFDEGVTYDPCLKYVCEDIYIHKDVCESLKKAIDYELNQPYINNKPNVHIL